MIDHREPDKRYWFRVKTYGWGWGSPTRWEGWVMLVAHVVLLVGGMSLCLSYTKYGWLWSGVLLVILTVLLFVISWVKGPRPRWRWGEEE